MSYGFNAGWAVGAGEQAMEPAWGLARGLAAAQRLQLAEASSSEDEDDGAAPSAHGARSKAAAAGEAEGERLKTPAPAASAAAAAALVEPMPLGPLPLPPSPRLDSASSSVGDSSPSSSSLSPKSSPSSSKASKASSSSSSLTSETSEPAPRAAWQGFLEQEAQAVTPKGLRVRPRIVPLPEPGEPSAESTTWLQHAFVVPPDTYEMHMAFNDGNGTWCVSAGGLLQGGSGSGAQAVVLRVEAKHADVGGCGMSCWIGISKFLCVRTCVCVFGGVLRLGG